IHTNLFIILLKGSHVFTGLRKLSFPHALTHIPVNKGSLGTHQVKPVVQGSPGLSNGCGGAQRTHISMYFDQVSTRYHSGMLVISQWDAGSNCEADGALAHKLDGTPGPDGSSGSVDIFGNHITTVQQAESHVFIM
ncbi:Hypothetical predicted protein, partial [Lynx pardinus]